MAQQPPTVFQITSLPGIKRDGTRLDCKNFQDGLWVRFQRGRPRKMGGYRSVTQLATGPIRKVFIDSRNGENSLHLFNPYGVEKVVFDNSGAGGAVVNRTPGGFSSNEQYTWSADVMYSQTGSPYAAVVAAATPDLADISSDVAGPVYEGNIAGTGALAAISDGGGPLTVSGGVVVLQPFLFVYGSNGLIKNSNPNDYSAATGWTPGAGAGLASAANPAGTKIVKGLPMRGSGNSPAGLFWALDSLVKVNFVGGQRIWTYDPVNSATSVLSKQGIIEHDNIYYWVGSDRFFMYNGIVQELPNQMNINYFFENLNFAQRQKVWATKVPRFGEIWWFFPYGSSEECDRAVIYNVREQTWYDAMLVRSAGAHVQTFPYPVLAGTENGREVVYFTTGAIIGTIGIGQTITGGTSSATGTVAKIVGQEIYVASVSGDFANGETVTTATGSATINVVPSERQLDVVWQHEFGYDKVIGSEVAAIRSYVETASFGLVENEQGGQNHQVRLTQFEPDFKQSGTINMYVKGKSYANSAPVVSAAYPCEPDTDKFTPREMRREMSLIFESNEVGGTFEMGRPLMNLEPGDPRG